MKQKMSPGKLLSMAGLLVTCVALLLHGLEVLSPTAFRLTVLAGVAIEVIAVIVIHKTNTF